jgi:type I restriction enzyme S subunit
MDLLEEYFDVAFSEPEGIQKLRELILNLAMRGRLVSQDKHDLPVTELLGDIVADKNLLVKDGAIKKLKATFEKPFVDGPYQLPHGWKWVQLGFVGNIFNGNSINSSEKEAKYAGAVGLPYIATKDVGYGFDGLNYDNGISIPASEPQFKIAHKNAVLICAEGGSAGKKCGITARDICFGNKLFANELHGNIPSKYILYVYLSPQFREMFASEMTGIIGGVSIAKFVSLPIPLPPLAEQHRIVSKLDQLIACCDEMEALQSLQEKKRSSMHTAALSQVFESTSGQPNEKAWDFIFKNFGDLYSAKGNIDGLREAILQLAITGKITEQRKEDGSIQDLLSKIESERVRLSLPRLTSIDPDSSALQYSVPDTWALLRLDAILILGPVNGYSPKAVSHETKVKSLTLSATTSGVFKGEHSKFIAEDIPPDSSLWLQDGDILVQRGNTIEYVGVPAIYRGPLHTYIYPDLMMKLHVSSELDSDYVYFAMSASPSRNFLRKRASGTSGTMPKINQGALKSLPIPIPPLAEQQRIVKKIRELMSLCDQLDGLIVSRNSKKSELLAAIAAKL